MAIPDQYVVLLEKSLDENKKLCSTIHRLSKQLEKEPPVTSEDRQHDQLTPNGKTGKTNASKSPVIPLECKNSVRMCYKELLRKENYDGFDLTVPFNDPANKSARDRLLRAVQDDNSSAEVCQYSISVITAAAKKYFHSLKDKQHKRAAGKEEVHKVKCRRQGRVRENCKRLRIGLAKKSWTVEKKTKIQQILCPSYMSEDETDIEELDDGKTLHMGYKVRRLSWVHENVRKLKVDLMKEYLRSLTEFQRSNFRQRKVVDGEFSEKKMPSDCPDWVKSGVF